MVYVVRAIYGDSPFSSGLLYLERGIYISKFFGEEGHASEVLVSMDTFCSNRRSVTYAKH